MQAMKCAIIEIVCLLVFGVICIGHSVSGNRHVTLVQGNIAIAQIIDNFNDTSSFIVMKSANCDIKKLL